LVLLLLAPFASAAATDGWPGLSPDCWPQPRLFHSGENGDLWKRNVVVEALPPAAEIPAAGTLSPNQSYWFTVENGRPGAAILVYSEKDHLTRIAFSNLDGLSDVKWINEKLIFMRPWWGRIAATDLIFDVEEEQVIYSEFVRDGTIAYWQFQESCPVHGCRCIKKK
ncbi:MAG: hypothetical protein ACU833_05850, partial [Gammaproteobacteria bacterium]